MGSPTPGWDVLISPQCLSSVRAHTWHGVCALLKVGEVAPVAQEAPGSCARAGHLTGASHGAAAPLPVPVPCSASSSSSLSCTTDPAELLRHSQGGLPLCGFPLSLPILEGLFTWNTLRCPDLLQGALCPCSPHALIQCPVSTGPRGSGLLLCCFM